MISFASIISLPDFQDKSTEKKSSTIQDQTSSPQVRLMSSNHACKLCEADAFKSFFPALCCGDGEEQHSKTDD